MTRSYGSFSMFMTPKPLVFALAVLATSACGIPEESLDSDSMALTAYSQDDAVDRGSAEHTGRASLHTFRGTLKEDSTSKISGEATLYSPALGSPLFYVEMTAPNGDIIAITRGSAALPSAGKYALADFTFTGGPFPGPDDFWAFYADFDAGASGGELHVFHSLSGTLKITESTPELMEGKFEFTGLQILNPSREIEVSGRFSAGSDPSELSTSDAE